MINVARSLIPRRTLFDNPTFFGAKISPDGHWISWLAPVDGVLNVWMASADDIKAAEPVTRTKGRPINWQDWSADGRFLMFLNDETGDENHHLFVADPVTRGMRDVTPLANVSVQLSRWSLEAPGDVAVMVEWAIGAGIAQRDKVAIFGGSYGGLAAFIGATFTPDVFCCCVPVVGITNLQTLLESMPPYWAGFPEFMYRSYGDPRTPEGRALLAERSPIHKVDRIKKPMLIFHGANDVRCKVAESDTIVAAMQAKGTPVTYVVYPDEGHGFHKPPNRLSYVAIAEAFLARYLGGACEPIGSDFDGSSHEVRAGAEILSEIGAR